MYRSDAVRFGENLPIFRVPGGSRALPNALVLTKKLMKLAGPRADTFAPVNCPLVSEKKNLHLAECNEKDVKRVLNEIHRNSGTRFFKAFARKRGKHYWDYLDYHWNGIEGSSCKYCTNLTRPKKKFREYILCSFERTRSNCKAMMYRSLKVAMVKNLQFVRFVPRPRCARVLSFDDFEQYEGLAAGITEDGVLCGVYLVTQ